MQNKINIIALVAAISILVLIPISIFVPWWQLAVGRPSIATVNVSPLNFNLALLGNSLTIPLVFALNLGAALSMACGGIIMLIYSIRPNKTYSIKLLGFGYKKPLYAVIIFVAGLLAMSVVVQSLSGFAFPLSGPGAMSLPKNMAPDGTSISVEVQAGFVWPFYFAIVVAGLCVAARIYHRKIVNVDTGFPTPPAPIAPQ